MKKTYMMNEFQKIEVEKLERGYSVGCFEKMGGRWVELGPACIWARLEDVLDEYGIDPEEQETEQREKITEVCFPELGYFTSSQICGLAEKLNGLSFMNFEIKSGNYAGNHSLIVQVKGRDESPEEIKNFFLGVALSTLAMA